MSKKIHELSIADIAIIKARIQRGDNQHDIAADYGFNQGRVCEIKYGKWYPEVAPNKEMLNETSL
jgi:hypothetical protein